MADGKKLEGDTSTDDSTADKKAGDSPETDQATANTITLEAHQKAIDKKARELTDGFNSKFDNFKKEIANDAQKSKLQDEGKLEELLQFKQRELDEANANTMNRDNELAFLRYKSEATKVLDDLGLSSSDWKDLIIQKETEPIEILKARAQNAVSLHDDGVDKKIQVLKETGGNVLKNTDGSSGVPKLKDNMTPKEYLAYCESEGIDPY